MNVVPDLGMGCVRSAIDRDRAHLYHISAPFPLTHSFPDPPVCHDTLAWVLGTGAFLPVSILWIFQASFLVMAYFSDKLARLLSLFLRVGNYCLYRESSTVR